MIDGTLGHHSWNVTDGLSNNETYYIQIAQVKDISTFSYSPGFKIHSNSSASATSTTSSPTATGYPSTTLSATASGATNTTESTSTSTGGSVVTSAPAPLAFVGAAAIGMLVF